VEAALAALDNAAPASVESTPAAHELAAVGAAGRAVATAPVRAERPGAPVRLAEVGRVAQVDEVGVGRRLELGVARDQLAPGAAHQPLLHLRATTATTAAEARLATRPGFPGMSRICAVWFRVPAGPNVPDFQACSLLSSGNTAVQS